MSNRKLFLLCNAPGGLIAVLGLLLLLLAGPAPGEQRYTGVWESGNDSYYLWSGVDWNNFKSKWEELSGKNLRLIDFETHLVGNQRKYSGVWRAGNDGHFLWVGVDWNNFKSKWEELSGKGLRLIDFETYVDGGQRKYAGVWRAGNDGHFLWVGVDWNNFTSKWEELSGKNLRLIDIEIYQDGNQKKYAGVWRAGNKGHYLWSGVDWENFTGKWHELKPSQRLIDLEINDGTCGDGCVNQVVSTGSYNYGITRTAQHCPGLPNSCGTPGANEVVFYRWPVVESGSERFVRHSALAFNDKFLTLPFSDTAVERRGIWLYSPGKWHHAGDYSRDDDGTFQIKASAPGRVVHVGWDNWSGNTVIVSHTVGGVQDAYRTIYMHLRNGASNDCTAAWSKTMATMPAGTEETLAYEQHLKDTGCTKDPAKRNLDTSHWGTNSQTIPANLLGKQVTRGELLAWAGNTGPGGKRGAGGPNTHLHIFFARRDTTNNEWYFFDPYGIYGPPSCYPSDVTGALGGACPRYPIAWQGGRPQYP